MSAPYRIPTDYFQKRAHHLGITMMVMGGCFLLYYLGLFGGVQGPLSPDSIGAFLAGQGVTRDHIKMASFGIFILALVWNHVINLVCFITGARRSCTCRGPENKACGQKTKKIRKASDGTGAGNMYQCKHGHLCETARFNPVKKGIAAHTVWAGALACSLCLLFFGN